LRRSAQDLLKVGGPVCNQFGCIVAIDDGPGIFIVCLLIIDKLVQLGTSEETFTHALRHDLVCQGLVKSQVRFVDETALSNFVPHVQVVIFVGNLHVSTPIVPVVELLACFGVNDSLDVSVFMLGVERFVLTGWHPMSGLLLHSGQHVGSLAWVCDVWIVLDRLQEPLETRRVVQLLFKQATILLLESLDVQVLLPGRHWFVGRRLWSGVGGWD
jgi:hypothetical protein